MTRQKQRSSVGVFEIVEKEMSKNSEIDELKSECIRKMSEIS